jgi:hypothetical protein
VISETQTRTPVWKRTPGAIAEPSAPLADGAVTIIQELTQDRQSLRVAVKDLLALWDRRELGSWSVDEVERLAEIRGMVAE